MSPRADLNLLPGMSLVLMIMMIMVAFQMTPTRIALPASANADTHPPAPSEVVLRVNAGGLMELTIDDEWGTHSYGADYNYWQPQTRDELERQLRRVFRDSTENRVLTLKADSTLLFGTIDEVVIAARNADVRVIRVVVDTK